MYDILTKNGSRGGIRTPDRVVNSHLLCQLSYPGMSTISLQHAYSPPSG